MEVVTLAFEESEICAVPEGSPQASPARSVRELLSRNLRLLAAQRVRIAIGSDIYSNTALAEALGVHGLNVFDNLTLLKMWCEATPQAIFPSRKIGRLREGYEASFLVLAGDPVRDFMNVKNIDMRIKQGEVLSLSK